MTSAERKRRDEAIRQARADAGPLDELARAHNLSRRQVQPIIAAGRREPGPAL